MNDTATQRTHLGTIMEYYLSGLSDTQWDNIASHHSPDVYNDASGSTGWEVPQHEQSDDEEFVYPGTEDGHPAQVTGGESVKRARSPPSPAQLEALYAAASSGDLSLLRRLFLSALATEDVQAFVLANDASTRTGFTVLHAAASRGYLDVVTWLVEECGAMPDLEDKEGETALHKVALNGHLPILTYLLPNKADVHARDADGWTALHNACSKGYLDIVRWLCEHGGAVDDDHSVDIRSKGGWTPLMNAASKGHLPIVLYLLNKHSANPFIRNNWGEMAYDIAAAVFEIWICEVLQKAENERWRNTAVAYNAIGVHTTVPIIIYEYQRLDTRRKTLTVSGGRPEFSASGLGRPGGQAPFELKLPTPERETGTLLVPAWRSNVQLPTRDNPWNLPISADRNSSAVDGRERSHFWLSDWTLDVTHPSVDVEEGWQYSHHFSDPDEQWTPDKPLQLERLLAGRSTALPTTSIDRSPRVLSSAGRLPQQWVRRRRWVRLMRRRLDIPPLPFLQPDGSMYYLIEDGIMIPSVSQVFNGLNEDDARELDSMRPALLCSARDYVVRARYMVGIHTSQGDVATEPISAAEARRAINKLECATNELRHGILGDEDSERRTQAEVLLHAYSRELERRRLSAGANGFLTSTTSDPTQEDVDGDSDDEEFHYPGSSLVESTRPTSRASNTTDSLHLYLKLTDFIPQLSQSLEFRVPTHEAPQKVMTLRWTLPIPQQVQAQWERDRDVHACRACQCRFNLFNRRHCRRCGRIFCDRCSAYRALLDPSDIVHDPSVPDTGASTSSQRVCQMCYEVVSTSLPSGLTSTGSSTIERIVVEQARLAVPGTTRSESNSQLSDLADCPVCGHNLADLGSVIEQETHVKRCLEGSAGSLPQTSKYLVYRLPPESVLIGIECVICLEEFTKGMGFFNAYRELTLKSQKDL